MLTCLQIRDFAIIDELQVELGPGLNVVTGETGAGKSILIGALELVLGGKGKPEYVRAGAKQAEVEALFEVGQDHGLRQKLEALDLADHELVVRRVVLPNGRTRAFINGRLATREQLADLTRGLTDISSQHLHHTLTDPATHLGYLDAFGGLGADRSLVMQAYQALERARSVLERFEARLRDRGQREASASGTVREIEAALPRLGEDAELEQESARLRHAESLLQLLGESVELLHERDESALDSLAQAAQRLAEAACLDPSLTALAEQLESSRAALEDTARDVGRHLHSVRADPEGLERLEQRLFELCKLKRRYGGTIETVLAQLEQCRAELDELEHHVEAGQALRAEHSEALREATRCARALSQKRHRTAPQLAQAISDELASLGMGEAKIHVEVRPIEWRSADRAGPDASAVAQTAGADTDTDPGNPPSTRRSIELPPPGTTVLGTHGLGATVPPTTAPPLLVREPGSVSNRTAPARLGPDGMDVAEFLIAPNRGEDALPLHKIASGGELSRAMLAIKCVLADLGPAGMYAFDEVDSGVGGGMAEIIGRKIRSVARHRQVLCVTHLPQIAVFADRHFKVEKSLQGERTLSTVRRLSAREQREEIARMLGGLRITPKTRAAARELLQHARESAA